MSKALEVLRADLARSMGRFFTGTADGGDEGSIIDLGGLERYTADDALKGALAYIRTDVGGANAAPEDESSWISSYEEPEPDAATELLTNEGFETAGAGGADIWADWLEDASDGALANEVVNIHTGADAAKLTAGVAVDARIYQNATVTPGKAYRVTSWTRGDGTYAGRYLIYDATNTANIVGMTSTGITGATYTKLQVLFVVPEDCVSVGVHLYCPDANGAICYFDDVSLQLCGAIYLATDLTAAVADGDTYEVYRGPLSKAQWDEAINLAIREAWPVVYEQGEQEVVSTGATEYALANTVEDVIRVNIVGTAAGDYADLPMQMLPGHLWTTTGVVGASLILQLMPYIDSSSKTLQVIHATRYAELAKSGTTTLDYPYLMMAAQSNAYQMLAGEAGSQSSAGQYLQLMNHWGKKAEQRKMELGKLLLGIPTIREVKD